jgi:WD40 repeat protein
MPTLKTRCPECDAKLRIIVDGYGEHEVECAQCGHAFTAELDDEEERAERKSKRAATQDEDDEDGRDPQRTRKRAGSGKTLILLGAVCGSLILVGGIIALAFAFGGADPKPVVQKEPVPKVAPPKQKPELVLPKVDPNPPDPNPAPKPPDNPPDNPPKEPPVPPPPVLPPMPPQPAEDVFARAAKFKPDGPLPELPPLPPVGQRPMLVLDPGGHTAFVKHVFLTPEADRVISVSEDKSVRVWDVLSGETVFTVRLPAGPDIEGTPFGAALSPDGKRLAVGGFPLVRGRNIPIYELSVGNGELLSVTSGAREVIRSLHYSADGKQIAVGCTDGTLQVYDFAAKKWIYEVAGAHARGIGQLRYNPKRAMVATVGFDREVKVWSLANKDKPTAALNLKEQGPNTVDWTSDGDTLAVGCTNGEVRMYDPAGMLQKTVPPVLENGKDAIQVARMRFLPGDKQLVFGGVAGLGWAGITDVDTGKRPVLIRDHSNTVMAVNCSPDGAVAVSAGGDKNEILVWDAKTGEIIQRLQTSSKGLWAVGWGKDGKSLAWGGINRHGGDGICPLEQTLRLDEFVPGPQPKPADFVRHVRDDGTYSVKVENFFEFTVFEDGKPLYRHKSRSDRIYSVTLLPGKGIVVGASWAMYLLDTKTGKLLREFRGDRGLTTALAPSPDGRYFVSGSSDQVLRVWSPERDEPVLSVFAVGREWIAWTSQGYYACSPYGERLIAWQVNRGLDKLPVVHPAVRFRASLYQPALIKYLIPAGDIRLALAMAAKFDRQQIAATGLADVLPPGVTLTAPAVADDKPITVSAVAEGNAKNPIVAMRLLVDGRPYQGAAGVKRFDRLQKAEATWEVTLDPGSHTLAVLAESPVSKGMSPVATVTRGGAEALPNLYVLAVGVSAYPGDLKLNFAASDAILITNTLKEKAKKVFKNIEVKLLTDKQATRRNIREGLDWLKAKMTPKDVGIVFFSGHGGRDEDTGKFYLIPVDIGPDLEGTCLSGEELKSRLEDMPGRLVAILDACHSGAVTEIKTGQADNLVRDLVTDDYGVIVLASSLGREYSLESPLTKAGFYTLGLTEGMGGRADFNRDGVIFLNELEYYAALRVQQLSSGQQNPTMGRPPTVKPFPIAKP